MAGLNSITSLIARVEKVQNSLEDFTLVSTIVRENEGEVLELNTDSQLFEQGVNSLGVSIHSYAPYAPKTVYLKQRKGQPYDRVTLRDTGNFHRSFFLQYQRDGFSIYAKDQVTLDLVDKYGEAIFGLTQESKGYLAKFIILPNLLTELRKQLL